MIARLAFFALLAVSHGYVSKYDFQIQPGVGFSVQDPFLQGALGGWGRMQSLWGSPRGRFMDVAGGLFDPRAQVYGIQAQQLDVVKSKVFQGIPCDFNDFLVAKRELERVPQEEVDDLEHVLKRKLSMEALNVQEAVHGLHRYESAILKEVVKVKIQRGLPIDKIESEVLKEVVKAKALIGIGIDEQEAKAAANNIKNKLMKGFPIDKLDEEVLLDFVKNKVARREPMTNIEAELSCELLKDKVRRGEPLDSVEGEVVVDAIKNKARRGSPVSRLEEDLLMSVVQEKQARGERVGNHAWELFHEVAKNKDKRGEIPVARIQHPVVPQEVFKPISLLEKSHFEDKIRFLHKGHMRPQAVARRAIYSQYMGGIGAGIGGLRQLASQSSRCPSLGFSQFLGLNRYSPYGSVGGQWNVLNTYGGYGLQQPLVQQLKLNQLRGIGGHEFGQWNLGGYGAMGLGGWNVGGYGGLNRYF